MKLRDQYDWIVLGDHPGALLSASLVAKLGLSVLVLPMESSQGLWVSSQDDVLDPESNFVLGIGDLEADPLRGLLGSCLRKVGMVTSEEVLFDRKRAVAQVLTPSRRVAMDPEASRLQEELIREWGSDESKRLGMADALNHAQNSIQEYWNELPQRLTLKVDRPGTPAPTGVAAVADTARKMANKLPIARPMNLSHLAGQLSKRLPKGTGSNLKTWFSGSSDTQIKRWKRSVHTISLAEFFEGMWSSATSSGTPENADLFELLHLLALSRSGGASFQGGMVAYREFLLRLARRNGADLPQKTDCQQIFIQNGRFAGVLPTGRGSMIAGNGAILGVPLDRVRPLMTTSGRSWFRGLKQQASPSGWKFSLALSLHPEAIPPGVCRRMIYQENGAPFLEVELSRHVEYGLKDRPNVLLFARTVMPMTEESLKPEYQRMVAARMLRKLTELYPFLEFHMVRIFPDFRTDETKDLSQIYGFSSLSAIPHNLLCYSGQGLGAKSGVEGLFLASGESFPEFGNLGGTVAALQASAWLAHRSGLTGPIASA